MANILGKLGYNSRSQVAAWARTPTASRARTVPSSGAGRPALAVIGRTASASAAHADDGRLDGRGDVACWPQAG